jgi:hypothetical protein
MPDVPEGSIVITPDQMYRESNEKFGHISASLDDLKQILNPLPQQVLEHDVYLNELRAAGLPTRFTKLEQEVQVLKGKWMWLAGVGFAASLIVGVFGSVIARALFGG